MRRGCRHLRPLLRELRSRGPHFRSPSRLSEQLRCFISFMKKRVQYLITLFLLIPVAGVTSTATAKTKPPQPWRAVHLLNYDTDADLDALAQNLPALAKQGINVIILEVDYNFAF